MEFRPQFWSFFCWFAIKSRPLKLVAAYKIAKIFIAITLNHTGRGGRVVLFAKIQIQVDRRVDPGSNPTRGEIYMRR